MITDITGKCSYENCDQPATHIACGHGTVENGRHPEVACYCLIHAKIVEDEGYPEYHDECPNCGCRFGVN